jgi:hypothetical protein
MLYLTVILPVLAFFEASRIGITLGKQYDIGARIHASIGAYDLNLSVLILLAKKDFRAKY